MKMRLCSQGGEVRAAGDSSDHQQRGRSYLGATRPDHRFCVATIAVESSILYHYSVHVHENDGISRACVHRHGGTHVYAVQCAHRYRIYAASIPTAPRSIA